MQLVDLTPEELNRLPRPREGFERFVEPLLGTYREHFDELAIRGIDADDALNGFRAYQALGSIEESARKHLEMVHETRALKASQTWSALLEVYAKARIVARTNIELRRAIADFQKFMAHGPRTKKPRAKKPAAEE